MRVLVVRLSSMGDVVHSLGPVQALQRNRPDLELTWVVQRPWAPLLEDLGLDVVPHDRGRGLAAFRRTARALRERRFDLAADLQGNWKAAVVARLSGAPRRLGVAGPWRRERWSALLLNERVGAGLGKDPLGRHPARQALEVLRVLAPGLEEEPPRLPARPEERAAEREEVRAAGVDPARPFAVFVATDPRDNRAWRPHALAAAARAWPVPVLCLLGPAESHLQLPPGIPTLRHPAGAVRRLLALGGLVEAVAGEIIGPDQGATHVLAATGARVRMLFGPQDPLATAPASVRVEGHSQPPACVPCRSRRCWHHDGPVCMDIAPEPGAWEHPDDGRP